MSRSVEVYGFSVPEETKEFFRQTIKDNGGTIIKEEWSTLYDKVNVKLFYNPKTIDFAFLNKISHLVFLRSPTPLVHLQVPTNDRLIFHQQSLISQ